MSIQDVVDKIVAGTLALGSAEVKAAIKASDDPGWWSGECAWAALRRGVPLDDPDVQAAIKASDYPGWWLEWCAADAKAYQEARR